ncbi:hypothetical protein H0176_23640 [Methylorubrum populi]|uniref:hypothetical protein n=1 Tax=Methylorubrum rhodesianum TaxID=29427 RepID=UPI00190C83DD|nr:hypothetical protein [Methylorubrum rhodesianum]MBK3406269.1 hypothetical protein [Methylorubrum rhodesianum]MBY0143237.1 hypothetical protein [Methylorubrum populi]
MDDVVRRMPGWVKMSEREQRDVINSTARIASDLVREAVKLVAHRDFPHMIVSLGKWTVKEGIKLEVSGSDSVEEITKLASNGGKQAILVFASVSGFMGSRGEPQADKDEPELPIDGEQPAHDPDTGEILDQGESEEGDEGGNPLPEGEPLPEPPEGDEEGDDDQDDGEAEEAASATSRRRGRPRQTVEA